MNLLAKLILTLATSTLGVAVQPASAGTATPWHNTLGGDVRIVFESVVADEKGALPPSIRGAIEIKLEDGWHTYWRDPGASGIPPTFHWAEGSELRQATIHYPAPVWVENDYGGYAGYTEPVLLPIVVETDSKATASFEGTLLLGICEDICIPVALPFGVEITPGNGSSLSDLVVRNAFAQLPTKVARKAVDVDFDGRHFVVKLDHQSDVWAGSDIRSLFVHIDGAQVSNPKRVMDDEAGLAFEAKINHIGGERKSRALSITAVTNEQAFEVLTTIELAGQ